MLELHVYEQSEQCIQLRIHNSSSIYEHHG